MTKPTEFNPFIGELITNRISDGETLKNICEEDDMPSKYMIYKWIAIDSEFATSYQRARVLHADSLADEIVNIADTTLDAQKARNMIDARKWRTAVINPKLYGTKVDININEKPNIKAALTDARDRVIIVNAQYIDDDDTQVIENVDDTADGTSDYKSLDPHEDDIFS